MDAVERRAQIREILSRGSEPVSASTLAGRLQVSRQVIVGDVALLRAANVPIAATPRGYILQDAGLGGRGMVRTIACRHTNEDIAEELYAIVDNGCGVLDVIVEHPVYGQISGQLHVFSRFDADDFLRKLTASRSLPLCDLTGGVHLHTISCPGEDAYARVLKRLEEKGILFGKKQSEET